MATVNLVAVAGATANAEAFDSYGRPAIEGNQPPLSAEHPTPHNLNETRIAERALLHQMVDGTARPRGTPSERSAVTAGIGRIETDLNTLLNLQAKLQNISNQLQVETAPLQPGSNHVAYSPESAGAISRSVGLKGQLNETLATFDREAKNVEIRIEGLKKFVAKTGLSVNEAVQISRGSTPSVDNVSRARLLTAILTEPRNDASLQKFMAAQASSTKLPEGTYRPLSSVQPTTNRAHNSQSFEIPEFERPNSVGRTIYSGEKVVITTVLGETVEGTFNGRKEFISAKLDAFKIGVTTAKGQVFVTSTSIARITVSPQDFRAPKYSVLARPTFDEIATSLRNRSLVAGGSNSANARGGPSFATDHHLRVQSLFSGFDRAAGALGGGGVR